MQVVCRLRNSWYIQVLPYICGGEMIRKISSCMFGGGEDRKWRFVWSKQERNKEEGSYNISHLISFSKRMVKALSVFASKNFLPNAPFHSLSSTHETIRFMADVNVLRPDVLMCSRLGKILSNIWTLPFVSRRRGQAIVIWEKWNVWRLRLSTCYIELIHAIYYTVLDL